MPNWIKVAVPVLLVINIITCITVITLTMNREKVSPARALHAEEMNKELKKAYLEANEKIWSTFKKTSTQAKEFESLDFYSLLKPNGHLSGLHFDRSYQEDTNRRNTIRNWALTNGAEANFLHNGMRYENGSITIPVTGLYFVYSHFKYFSPNNENYGMQNISHHGIFRYNALTRTEETLLANHVTQCKEGLNDGAHLEYSSDIRGVVYVNVGDKLTVKASDFDMLNYDRDWHYSGAYLI